MPRAVWSGKARRDVRSILKHIEAYSSAAAARFAQQLDQKCQTVAQFPESGGAREDIAAGLRSFLVDSYIVFYRPVADGIQVVRIIHGARDLPSFFD